MVLTPTTKQVIFIRIETDGIKTDISGVQWNQSTDSWTILDNSDLETYIGVTWNQSTDTWDVT